MFGSKESESAKPSENDSAKPSNRKPAILDFEGKKYEIEKFPDELKELLKGLQVADNQMRMYQDTLNLMSKMKFFLIINL